MIISWEDRKGFGTVDGTTIKSKPMFSFPYAWFLVTNDVAQFVESHEYGVWNKDMTPEQRVEVESFYNSWTPPSKPVEEVKLEKSIEIKVAAQDLYSKPVTDVNGVIWRGGKSSATSIKNGVELAEFAGETSITLRDISSEPHVMTMNEARAVAAIIGAAWQTVFQAEEEALRQLNLVDLNSPTVVTDIQAISINNYL